MYKLWQPGHTLSHRLAGALILGSSGDLGPRVRAEPLGEAKVRYGTLPYLVIRLVGS